MTIEQNETAHQIPDDLSRELCEALNIWDGGFYDIDEDELVEQFLAPVIAKHLDAIAPPRQCCQSRRGTRHSDDCAALTAALMDNPTLDTEGMTP